MNIVLICDRNYLIPTKVTINSIVRNKRIEDNITIYIIGVGLSVQDLNPLKQFQDEHINIIPVIPDNACFEQIKVEHMHVSKAALYKFLIPELIDVDKILYLDSDMLVLGSLKDLYETDLGDMYAAVVRDIIGECLFHFQQKHNISFYFNSGMMLLNLKVLRKQGVVQKLTSVRKKDTTNLFMDQDTFNKVFDKKVVLVSPKYNYILSEHKNIAYSLEEIADFYDLGKEEASNLVRHPVILHLTDKEKPWNNSDASNRDLWYQYAFKEDFPYVIQNIARSWKRENAILKQQLELDERRKKIFQFKLAQQQENIYFYKNNRQFIINNFQLSGVMKEIWKAREELSHYLEKWMSDDKCKIMIYGAGKMGQAVFKCLWFSNYAQRVDGFVVDNKENNVDILYEKSIFSLEEIKSTNVVIIIAVKNISEDEIRRKIESLNYNNIFHISRILQ